MEHKTRNIVFILLFVFAGWTFFVRLTDHAPNMTPMGALALFSGAYLAGRWKYILPLVLLFVSDFFLGFYEPVVMIAVYGSFLVVTWIGNTLRKHSIPLQAFLGAASASAFFFLVTNFAVWASTPLYEKTINGLLLSYTLALPFYRNMLVGDVIYTTAFLGAAALMVRYSITLRASSFVTRNS